MKHSRPDPRPNTTTGDRGDSLTADPYQRDKQLSQAPLKIQDLGRFAPRLGAHVQANFAHL